MKVEFETIDQAISDFTDAAHAHFHAHGYAAGYLGAAYGRLLSRLPEEDQQDELNRLREQTIYWFKAARKAA